MKNLSQKLNLVKSHLVYLFHQKVYQTKNLNFRLDFAMSSGTAAQLLTQVRTCEQPKDRLKLLHKIKTLIVDQEPALLDNFLEEMIDQNQFDPEPAIRSFVVYSRLKT